MPRRNARPLTIKPKGLSDAIDGTNAFPGAMQSLQNLVPASSTASLFVPRPASQVITDFTGSGIANPGVVTAQTVIGNRVYGMVPTTNPPNRDVPFIYDLVAQAFVAISNVTSANTPITQPTTGDWQPPHMEMIANTVITTHPGFPGGVGPYFGWIDQTGFSSIGLVGNTSSGTKVIRSISGDGTSTPILDGVQPGQQISGAGIPGGTVVVSVANGTTDINTNGDTHSNTLIDNIPGSAVALMEVGMYVTGPGVVAGTYISAFPGGGTSITLSQATTATASTVAINVSGGGTITISNNATANATLVALTITGGTAAAPRWNAGNTNVNPLIAAPAWVSQFNGRAWYAVENGEVFSDSLLPLNVTNADQALTFGDSTPVTCSAGLPLSSITVGGIIQALIVVKGAETMYQITGDAATDNLSSNELNVSVGSLAPNTFTPTPVGLAFVATDGLRFIDFTAHVGDPVGANGAGVSVPFINALFPTRMCAAFNQNVLRVTVQSAIAPSQAPLEYWLDFNLKIWTGPHTFPASLISAAPDLLGIGKGFVSIGYEIAGKIWESGTTPVAADIYIENGLQLSWSYQTVLLPDNQEMAENRMGQSAVAMQLPGGQTVGFSCINEIGTVLDQVSLTALSGSPTIWGSFIWGQALWGGVSGFFRQYDIGWHMPLIFKQMSILAVGVSQAGFSIGNLYLKYQPLGYLLTVLNPIVFPPPAPQFITTEAGDGSEDILTEDGQKILTEGPLG